MTRKSSWCGGASRLAGAPDQIVERMNSRCSPAARAFSVGRWLLLPVLMGAVAVPEAAAKDVRYPADKPKTEYVAQVPPPTPGFKQKRADQEFLILQMTLGSYVLSDAMFGYPSQGSLMLPLQDVVRALDFPIDVDAENGRAAGWFLAENRLFSLDLDAGQAIVEGKRIDIEPGYVEKLPDGIFVDVRMLARWFPVDFKFDISNLLIEVESREPLPVEAKLKREQLRDRLLSQRKQDRRNFPKIEVPYQWISWPVSDTTLDFTVSKSDGETRLSRNMNTQATADLGKLNADIFVAGTEKDQLTQARLKLGRQSTEPNLLGPMKATEFAVGDITSPQVSMISTTENGRGFKVGNEPIDRPQEFDRITLNGDLASGWEVELYRNEVLLDFRQSQANGRYTFENVPLLFGVNVVKLVFHGPQGQRREEIQQFRVGPDQIKPGQQTYSVSVNQQDRQLLLGDDKTVTDTGFQGKTRYFAQYKVGLTQNLSMGANVASIPFERGHRVYTGTNLITSIGPVFGRLDVVKDATGGWGSTVSAQTRLFGVTVIGEHTRLFDFLSEQFDDVDDPLEQRSKLRLDGVIRTDFLPHIPYALSVTRDDFRSGLATTSVENRLSTAIGRASISNTLTLALSEYGPESTSKNTTDATGSLQVGGRLGDIRLRGQLGYEVWPSPGVESSTLTADWRLTPTFNARAGVTKQLTGDGSFGLTFGVNSDLDIVAVGLDTEAHDNGDYSGKVSLTYSWGKDAGDGGLRVASKPTAQRGTMTARVFRDLNGNGKFDEGIDEPMEGIKFRAGSTVFKAATNKDGVAFVTELDTYTPVRFEVDQASLIDPFWIASPEGVQVTLRPGAPGHVEFAVVSTGEIDGTVYRKRGRWSRQISDVQLQLIDDEGDIVREVRSQYDGFYLFDFIKPGTYTLRVDPEQTQRLNLPQPPDRKVTIGQDGTVLNGEDFVIGGDSEEGLARAYLAAFPDKNAAERGWAEIRAALPSNFGQVDAEYIEKPAADGTAAAVELFATPFENRKAAENACTALRAQFGETWCNPMQIDVR